MPEISLLIPTKNNQNEIRDIISNLNNVINHNSLIVETVIIDNDSKDNTVKVAFDLASQHPSLHIRVLSRKNLSNGFGSVIRFGLAFSKADYCAVIQPDGSFPINLIPSFISHLRNDCQLIQCNRYLSTENNHKIEFKYKLSQYIYRAFIKLFLGLNISDSTFGFRAFNRVYIQALGLSSNGFSIFPEMTLKVIMSGGKVEYMPGVLNDQHDIKKEGFKLRNEIWGYVFVLIKCFFHRIKFINWY